MPSSPPQNEHKLCLSEPEAAKAMSVSTRTLFRYRSEGKIGFIKFGDRGAKILYPVSELEKFIAENLQRSAAQDQHDTPDKSGT